MNKNGEKPPPCLIPLLTDFHSDGLESVFTEMLLLDMLYMTWIIQSGMLSIAKMLKRVFLSTLMKAFSKSMEVK
jgi:hypothetical protein